MRTKPIPPSHLNQILSKEVQARFWSKVEILTKEKCWRWKAGFLSNGYGQFHCYDPLDKDGRRTFASHKIAWVSYHKSDVPNGLEILHSCINSRWCCNPHHLRPGTQKENGEDMVNQGRARGKKRPGESNNLAKLTDKAVIQMRKIRQEHGTPFLKLAAMFGVSNSTAFSVIKRETWTHI